jgi:hypothetical protein
MINFDTTLLREKFVITDKGLSHASVAAVSNRMVLNLVNADNVMTQFVVRAQNMHSCIRLCARILNASSLAGIINDAFDSGQWQRVWSPVHNQYERKYNPDLWAAIYCNGKAVFSYGERHPFLDVIEKCAVEHGAAYEMSIPLAEDKISTNKPVEIDYNGNVALAIDYEPKKGRNGIILRTASRSTTFSYTIEQQKKKGDPLNYAQCLSSTAAFLEGIQLSYKAGHYQGQFDREEISKRSDEYKHMQAAYKRLRRLSAEVSNLEETYIVNYRPEKPSFQNMIEKAKGV